MFHDGSLQSGITLAIQQQKVVACLVRDQSLTSELWETQWLTHAWVSRLLDQKAILLRIEAGSTEAGFLSAFCDISSSPTFVVIQNGKLEMQLKQDVTENDFVNAIRTTLGADPIPGLSAAQTATPAVETQELIQPVASIATDEDLYEDATDPPKPGLSQATSSAKGKEKAPAAPAPKPESSSRSMTAAQQAAREEVRKKKKEEADELARVKARIEADKAERKAQAEARKLEREREKNAEAQSEAPSWAATPSRGSQAKMVSLQVRLFDGRTIRSTFPRTAMLEKEVRKWVDEEFSKLSADDPNINNKKLPPYHFRHILSPKPSRELSAGDENQTLGEIDLAPSATLVLVPVKGYTEAYSEAGGSGVVGAATGLVGGAFGLLSSTVGFVGNTIGSVIGYGSTPAEPQTQATQHGQPSAPRSHASPQRPANADQPSIRVRTLADQRARDTRDQQFYNGNQLDTVPRNDDNDRK